MYIIFAEGKEGLAEKKRYIISIVSINLEIEVCWKQYVIKAK